MVEPFGNGSPAKTFEDGALGELLKMVYQVNFLQDIPQEQSTRKDTVCGWIPK